LSKEISETQIFHKVVWQHIQVVMGCTTWNGYHSCCPTNSN